MCSAVLHGPVHAENPIFSINKHEFKKQTNVEFQFTLEEVEAIGRDKLTSVELICEENNHIINKGDMVKYN